jgi:hypothetical protein
MRRLDCHDSIKQVEFSYETALQTVTAMISLVEKQPAYLRIYHLDLNHMRTLAQELHDLYFVRMFACFESSLRHYWRISVRDTKPSTGQLLSLIAGRRSVPQDTLDGVQEIRNFRNYLIHEEHEVGRRLSIDESSKLLNEYLARLPLKW